MNKNQKGFSAVELLLVLVVAGLLAAAGWFVYSRQNSKTGGQQSSTQTTTKTEKTTPYTFKELGVTVDILDGWEVKTDHTKQEGVNFYNWTVEKPGADGKISLSSAGFRGGFSSCADTGDTLTAATVQEVVSTQNPKLTFMAWSYPSGNGTSTSTGIVQANQAVFKATNSTATAAVQNKDLKAGTYYFCISEPLPGSLKLNSETAPGFSRNDSIGALASNSSTTNYVPLSTTAQSYADIKTMLTSLR